MIMNFISLESRFTFSIRIKGGGGGVQGQKRWNHDFEITGDPKGTPSGSTFWWGFKAPESYGYLWGRAPFWAQKIDNSK